jgi:hypothetical protein
VTEELRGLYPLNPRYTDDQARTPALDALLPKICTDRPSPGLPIMLSPRAGAAFSRDPGMDNSSDYIKEKDAKVSGASRLL